MKRTRLNISKPIKGLVLAAAVLVSIGFVEKRQAQRTCQEVNVALLNSHNNYFISQDDVVSLVTDGGGSPATGQPLGKLPLKEIEQRLMAHEYIKQAQVYKDLGGRLHVQVQQKKPIARLLRPNKPNAYVSQEGHILPVSERYTARVLLVSGPYADTLAQQPLNQHPMGQQVLHLLHYITNNEFWRAQVAQLHIDAQGHITLYPQITKQVVEFGPPVQVETKLAKLRLFYEEILPRQGWNHYTKVNVQYNNQIVAQ